MPSLSYRLKRSDLLACYEFSFKPRPDRIIFRLHQSLLDSITERFNAEIQDYIRVYVNDKDLPVGDFVPPNLTHWGFGGVMTAHKNTADFYGWQMALPWAQARDTNAGLKLYQISATLSVLGVLFELNEFDTHCQKLQLIHYMANTGRRLRYGCNLTVFLSPAIVNWLRTFKEVQEIESIETVMRRVFCRANNANRQARQRSLNDFTALYRPPCWINFDIPGNSCGLDPEDYYDHGQGYELLPHNVDYAAQQLALFCGVAKLCDLWRDANLK